MSGRSDQLHGLYYQPTYSTTGVTLRRHTGDARAVERRNRGCRLTVTLTGSGYLPGDTITPTFTDHMA